MREERLASKIRCFYCRTSDREGPNYDDALSAVDSGVLSGIMIKVAMVTAVGHVQRKRKRKIATMLLHIYQIFKIVYHITAPSIRQSWRRQFTMFVDTNVPYIPVWVKT